MDFVLPSLYIAVMGYHAAPLCSFRSCFVANLVVHVVSHKEFLRTWVAACSSLAAPYGIQG